MKFLFWNVNLKFQRRYRPSEDDIVNLLSMVRELRTDVDRIERKVYRDEKKVAIPEGAVEQPPSNRLFSPYLGGSS